MPILNKSRLLGAMLSMSLCALSAAAAERGRVARETDLKAVFLFNFSHFVEWPPEAFPGQHAPFVIGIIGNDPFGASLDNVTANETVDGRPIVVRRYTDVHEILDCQILFVGESEAARLGRILEFASGKSILTVGESDAFSARGGMIRFFVVQNKLRIRINPVAAKAAGLSISSKLLRQAEIVDASFLK